MSEERAWYGATITGKPPNNLERKQTCLDSILGRTNWVDLRYRLALTLLLYSNPNEHGEKISYRELTGKVCGCRSQEDKQHILFYTKLHAKHSVGQECSQSCKTV